MFWVMSRGLKARFNVCPAMWGWIYWVVNYVSKCKAYCIWLQVLILGTSSKDHSLNSAVVVTYSKYDLDTQMWGWMYWVMNHALINEVDFIWLQVQLLGTSTRDHPLNSAINVAYSKLCSYMFLSLYQPEFFCESGAEFFLTNIFLC